MLLITGKVAFAGGNGTDAVAECFEQIGGTTGSRSIFGDFRLNGLPHEDRLGHPATLCQFSQTTVERMGQFAGEYTHFRSGNTPAIHLAILNPDEGGGEEYEVIVCRKGVMVAVKQKNRASLGERGAALWVAGCPGFRACEIGC